MANLEVYLKHDVDKLGKAGERIMVKNGYARNFLIPRDLAVPVTKNSLRALENAVRQVASRKKRDLKDAQSVAQHIQSLECRFLRQSGEEDKIFGSVTARDIAAVLQEKGLDIDSRRIVLERPIRSLGIHNVQIRLHQEVAAELKVWVEKEEVEQEQA
ncbi:MAG: 50S ribosomal protein L9 [Candidatus Coatesbacteria bacterium]|nr:50S ribosomal protein L9 [Candidatus Coatesbacteria bacterium]